MSHTWSAVVVSGRTFFRSVWSGFSTQWVLILTLIAVGIQSYYQQQQTALSQRITAMQVMQQARNDIISVEQSIYDQNSVFQKAEIDSCTSLQGQVPFKTQIVVKHLIDTYEIYFNLVDIKLISPPEWDAMCRGAHELIDSNCVLKLAVPAFFAARDPNIFVNAFKNCKIA